MGLTLSATTLGVAEGDDAEYTVRLASQPTAQVTVAITGHSGTDLTLDATSLTFTTATWNTAQTVTVSAGEDDDGANDAATLVHTASGGDYASETASVAVTVTDDDGGPDAVDDGAGGGRGDDAEYTVRLATQPTAQVTVAITGQAGTDLTLDATSLTFTTATWNTAQTVTVTAGEDDDAVNDAATLLHTASGGDYASETASVAVTTTDDDDGGDHALGDDAGGGRGRRRRVHGAPGDAADGSGDGGDHGAGGDGPDAGCDQPDVHDGDLEHGADGDGLGGRGRRRGERRGDAGAHGLGRRLRGRDGERGGDGDRRRDGGADAVDDGAGGGRGDDGEYTVRLSTQPTAQVTVAITGQAGTDLTLDATSLTFTTATWNTAQTVTVSAGEDDDGANDAATLVHTASGGDYASETASVAVTVTDDDDGGTDAVDDGAGGGRGDDGEYTVRLSTQPTAQVTVAITGQAGTDLTLDATSLTFTTATWNTAQTVTVTAGEDDDGANDAATLLHTASGGDYASETASVAVTTTDDDDGGPDAVGDDAGGGRGRRRRVHGAFGIAADGDR